MSKLKVPSLQHLARNWRADPEKVKWQLIELVKHPPTFNYNPLFSATRDLLIFKQPYEQVADGLRRIRRDDLRENFLEVLPLLSEHFEQISPDFVLSVDKRYYAVSKTLLVPFAPPLLYGVSGKLYFPWLSFWRSKSLSSERLSLFVTVVDDMLLQDPDFEGAQFDILDFSVQDREQGRELTVINSRDIPRLSLPRKAEMLQIFAEGYSLAEVELSRQPQERRADDSDRDLDPNQPGFFD